MVRAVTDYIRSNTPGGAYIIGGGPAHWRTSTNDADRNPEFVDVWLEAFDAISPWTIGRYNSLEDVDRFSENNVKGDLELIRKRNEEAEQGVPGRRHIDYIPVVLPGGSVSSTVDHVRRGLIFLRRASIFRKENGDGTISSALGDASSGDSFGIYEDRESARSTVRCGTSMCIQYMFRFAR